MQNIIKQFRARMTSSQEGVALLYALITIAVLLSITGSMAGLIVKESQMSSGVDSSVSAYAAAESGIEHASYLTEQSSLPANPCLEGSVSYCYLDASNTALTYQMTFSPSATGFDISSTGKAGNTTRKIEKDIDRSANAQPFLNTYDNDPGLVDVSGGKEHAISWLDDDGSTTTSGGRQNIKIPVDGSYTQAFVVNITDISQTFSIGLSDGGIGKIMFNSNGATGANGISLSDGVNLAQGDALITGSYYIEIKYVKASSVKVTITNGPNPGGSCARVLSLATSVNPNLTRVRFEASGGVTWSSPTVNLGSGATVSVMGIKAETSSVAYKPYINSLSSSSGSIGSTVSIIGSDFGNSAGTVRLTNKSSGAIINISTNLTWSDLAITFTVPVGTPLGDYFVTIITSVNIASDPYDGFSVTADPLVCPAGQFKGDYYNNTSTNYDSVPGNGGPLALTRCDSSINFDWGTGSPTGQADYFSAQWTGTINFATAGVYRFNTTSDDGVRLIVGGVTVIDQWTNHSSTLYSANVTLPAGDSQVVMQYYENTGRAIAQLSWVPAPLGSALFFGGVKDYVSTSYNTGCGYAGDLSAEAWINPTSIPPSGRRFIAAKYHSQTGWYFDVDSSGNVYAHLHNGSTGQAFLVGHVTSGSWAHVAFTYNRASTTGNVITYLNGNQTGQSVYANYVTDCSTSGMTIGKASHYDGEYYSGLIDELRVYSKKLTTTDISDHYNSGYGQYGSATEGNIYTLWHFDEGAGAAANSSVGGFTGTLMNDAQWVLGHVAKP